MRNLTTEPSSSEHLNNNPFPLPAIVFKIKDFTRETNRPTFFAINCHRGPSFLTASLSLTVVCEIENRICYKIKRAFAQHLECLKENEAAQFHYAAMKQTI